MLKIAALSFALFLVGGTALSQNLFGPPQLVTPMGNNLGGSTITKVISAATTNSTSVATGARTLYDISAFNTNAATAYLKFYDKASGPTCNSDIVLHTFPLVQNIVNSPVSIVGRQFTLGIGLCITGALADNDNTAATTGIVVNLGYK